MPLTLPRLVQTCGGFFPEQSSESVWRWDAATCQESSWTSIHNNFVLCDCHYYQVTRTVWKSISQVISQMPKVFAIFGRNPTPDCGNFRVESPGSLLKLPLPQWYLPKEGTLSEIWWPDPWRGRPLWDSERPLLDNVSFKLVPVVPVGVQLLSYSSYEDHQTSSNQWSNYWRVFNPVSVVFVYFWLALGKFPQTWWLRAFLSESTDVAFLVESWKTTPLRKRVEVSVKFLLRKPFV